MEKQINPAWVLRGEGARYLVPADTTAEHPHVVRIPVVRPPRECSAQDLFDEMMRRGLERY